MPPPRPIRNPKARDFNDYSTVSGKKVAVKDRLTPTRGGRSKQLSMAKSIEDEPRTFSYNTKVFNREIMALREEEEALISHSNATRKREYRVDQLKYAPT